MTKGLIRYQRTEGRPGSPATRGPRRAIFARWGEGTGLRRWGGVSKAPERSRKGAANGCKINAVSVFDIWYLFIGQEHRGFDALTNLDGQAPGGIDAFE